MGICDSQEEKWGGGKEQVRPLSLEGGSGTKATPSECDWVMSVTFAVFHAVCSQPLLMCSYSIKCVVLSGPVFYLTHLHRF